MGVMVGLFERTNPRTSVARANARSTVQRTGIIKFRRTVRKNGEDVKRAVDKGNPAAARSAGRTGAPPRKQPGGTLLPSCYPSAPSCPI